MSRRPQTSRATAPGQEPHQRTKYSSLPPPPLRLSTSLATSHTSSPASGRAPSCCFLVRAVTPPHLEVPRPSPLSRRQSLVGASSRAIRSAKEGRPRFPSFIAGSETCGMITSSASRVSFETFVRGEQRTTGSRWWSQLTTSIAVFDSDF
eukprot:scaffold54943_cov47-Phaeocystis_antarctica.AAC.3